MSPDHRKLSAARARLILERPFIGSLVMHLALEAADPAWCRTFASDARTFYFNPAYIDRLDFDETQFVLAHEALHCALGHFARRGHRTRRRWDLATDYAANMLLAEEGLRAPPGALMDRRYRGMSAEEIYGLLPDDIEGVTLDRHLGAEASSSRQHAGNPAVRQADDSSPRETNLTEPDADGWDDAGDERRTRSVAAAEPGALAPDEREALARRWQSRVAAAAQHARRAGRLSSSCARAVDDGIQPQLPWRVLLARYMVARARDDYSYQRLSRRDGSALMPRLASGELNLVVAIDTSGSIGDPEIADFAAEIDALKSQLRGRITLLACDEGLDERAPWRFESWEPLEMPSDLRGGGGTSFVPVFDWVEREHMRPDALVYFPDAEGDFPAEAPTYPVVWLVKGRAAVPWGERIQLN
ncbi:MAG: vWA domain-containing protein [Burkholderiales bacterium]